MSEANLQELHERQESELEALKAIFLDDLKDLREELKLENESNPYFSIRLRPQRGSSFVPGGVEYKTYIYVIFKIPPQYPLKIPEIILGEHKGLSNQNLQVLKDELVELATTKIGEEMILDITQHIETFLYKNYKVTGSFYDEMLKQKKEEELLIIEQRKLLEEKERQAIIEEIQRKQIILREEARERKNYLRTQNEKSTSPPSSPIKDGDSSFPKQGKRQSVSSRRRRSTSEGSENNSESSEMRTLEFTINKSLRYYNLGEEIGESDRGTKVFAGMDSKTGSLVTIVQWKFLLKCDKKGRLLKLKDPLSQVTFDQIIKQIHSFETEFHLLQKLEHPNIILYLGFKVIHDGVSNLQLYIVQEFVKGTSLKSYLQDRLSLDFSLIRHYSEGILKGLTYLHSNNIVHRYLRDTSVFLDANGTVKLGDYGIERKVFELYQSTAYDGGKEIEEKFSPSIGRGFKKADVYRFGVLILSLIRGRYVSELPPKIPSSLPKELEDFLNKCLWTNEQERWTASQLLEHPFIKMSFQKSPKMIFSESEKIKGDFEEESDEKDEGRDSVDPSIFQNHSIRGHSRLQSEFEILRWLGKGGFGDVLKVKNKLDGGIYALKRIKLNPKNKLLNKKITREVKLLSRLNHENIVRYFNSWIETVVGDYDSTSETTCSTNNQKLTSNFKEPNLAKIKNSLGFDDNIEALAPPVKDSEWNISIVENEKEFEYESSEDEDIFGTSFICLPSECSSEDIVFENKQSGSSEENDENDRKVVKKDSPGNKKQKVDESGAIQNVENVLLGEIQYLYIQMEFCEKSTLRTAIDSKLYEDLDRVWRLFREIIEGLAHIHSQGMIHRDLKPVNIFLDRNDHVKIGDLGLATNINILAKPSNENLDISSKLGINNSIEFDDGSLTGQVGTALYLAPELIQASGAKSIYNQKVDVYSLGIVFFEMVYPLDTSMERIKVLVNVRKKNPTFPSDFESIVVPNQRHIINWLLNHDPSQRPTLQELIQSDLLPPPQVFEQEVQNMIHHTLANSQSRSYKYLVSSCFEQIGSLADGLIYDMENAKMQSHLGIINQSMLMRNVIKNIQSVFERRGSLLISTPLLMPKSDIYQQKDCVHLMSQSGSVLMCPYDLRVRFGRFLVWNSLVNIKRYSIEKVYRERKFQGFHPRELNEIAYDIISSTQGNQIADAEVLTVVFNIMNDLPWLREKNFTIRIGHTHFLDAILLHYAIDEKFHEEIKNILADIKMEKNSKSQVQTHLVSLCLPDQFITMLFHLMEIEGSLQKVSAFLKGIIRKKAESATLIKEALHTIETLIGLIDTFGLKSNVIVAPSMVFGTRIYSGLIFQIVCDLKKRKNKLAMDIIAAGGRYDKLIKKYRLELEMTGLLNTSESINQYAVGVSISLDKLIGGVGEAEIKSIGWNKSVDAIVCSLGQNSSTILKEKIVLLKEFWANGIHCSHFDSSQTLESVEEYSREVGATYIVILKESEIFSNLLVRILDKDRFTEKRMVKQEVIELILKNRRASYSPEGNFEGMGYTLNNPGLIKSEGGFPSSSISTSRLAQLSTDTTSGLPQIGSTTAAPPLPSVNISFVAPSEKERLSNWKRRYETQIMSHIGNVLPKLSRSQVVELLGMEVNSGIINSLSSLILSDKEEFGKSVTQVIDKNPRQKKYLKSICDEIYELNFKKNASVIIIYGTEDNSFKLLL